MRKNDRERAIYLTEYILEEYWQKNLAPLKEHIHNDIMWIGSMDEEYVHGATDMLKRLEENNNEMPPVFLDQQEYSIVQNEGKVCVITGRYRAFTQPDSGLVLCEKQRVTFVWEKVEPGKGGELKIKHLHLSNVLHIQSEDERFPTRAGKENYEYMQRIMAERSLDKVVSLKDGSGYNHILNYSDIMYIKADGNYVKIILANGQESLRVRKTFYQTIKIMPEDFVKVSRSLMINRSYVKSVYRNKLIMMDDAEFQIPAPACVAVKKAITLRNSKE